MKTLISWLAFNTDFKAGKVDTEGSPNYTMHNLFWKFDRHIILCSAKSNDTKAEYLINQLTRDFPQHPIDLRYMNVPDVIDLSEIKTKIETLLISLRNNDITIFFSPGTSIMQVTWYICHTNLGLKTKLVQVRPGSKSKSGKPELLEISTDMSTIPVTSIIKEALAVEKESGLTEPTDYLITATLKPVYEKADKIAATDSVTVLINGETGTGKEHLARYIHDNSARKEKPFIAINCSVFNDDLLTAELFGYAKGAYTGAVGEFTGLFKKADGGTIFLDEISDISPKLQQSLLRVIQQKEIQPLQKDVEKVNVRIIAATNKNLTLLCKDGKFRWDLYFRLAIAELEVPSLIERGSVEVVQMTDFFLKTKSKEFKKGNMLNINPNAMQFLKNYTWPGNVRELENLIETLYVFCDKEVDMEDLPARLKEPIQGRSLKWKDIERDHIEYVLKLKKGNQRQAWISLDYGSINTLRNKIKEYNIDI